MLIAVVLIRYGKLIDEHMGLNQVNMIDLFSL